MDLNFYGKICMTFIIEGFHPSVLIYASSCWQVVKMPIHNQVTCVCSRRYDCSYMSVNLVCVSLDLLLKYSAVVVSPLFHLSFLLSFLMHLYQEVLHVLSPRHPHKGEPDHQLKSAGIRGPRRRPVWRDELYSGTISKCLQGNIISTQFQYYCSWPLFLKYFLKKEKKHIFK